MTLTDEAKIVMIEFRALESADDLTIARMATEIVELRSQIDRVSRSCPTVEITFPPSLRIQLETVIKERDELKQELSASRALNAKYRGALEAQVATRQLAFDLLSASAQVHAFHGVEISGKQLSEFKNRLDVIPYVQHVLRSDPGEDLKAIRAAIEVLEGAYRFLPPKSQNPTFDGVCIYALCESVLVVLRARFGTTPDEVKK